MKTIKASDNILFFTRAEQFVLPHEKHCCALMQRILSHDESVFIFSEDDAALKIKGVIAFTPGRVLFHCLPEYSRELFNALKEFCCHHNVFCITGMKDGTEFIEQAIYEATRRYVKEQRDYYFMEFTGSTCQEKLSAIPQNNMCALKKCTPEDAENLLKLHLEYVRVEVLPEGKALNAESEKASLNQILKTQSVYALAKSGAFAAKAQTNALAKNYVQIGGVYTLPEYRRKGFASFLVNYIALSAKAHNKNAVLFVKVKNICARHSYEKAGFVKTGDFLISYY